MLLQSTWLAMTLGMVIYLMVTFVLWQKPAAELAAASQDNHVTPAMVEDGPSWIFFNPEVEMLVNELKKEKEGLALRQNQLDEFATRLQTERQELNQVTQKVYMMQKEFDQSVTRIRDEEAANIKKLAKMYATMTPEGATAIFKQMEEATMVKIMATMKDTETAPILEAMAKQGEADAKRVAAISERLRLSISSTAKKPTP
jgi:flagellar motility protein MotE (MotC chaperone)